MAPRVDSARSVADLTNDEPATMRPQHSSPGTVHNTAVDYVETQTSGSAPSPAATTPQAVNKTLAQEVEERLANDADYQAALRDLEAYGEVEAWFTMVDRNTGIGPDSRIEYANLIALINDEGASDSAREAARRLADPKIWNRIAGDDQWVGLHDVQRVLADMNAKVAETKGAVADAAKAERGVSQSSASPASGQGADASGTTGSTGQSNAATKDPKLSAADQAIRDEIKKASPKPDPSTMGGLEGAYENSNNLLGWAETEMDRLNGLLAQTDNPAIQKEIENKMNQLTRRMQSITAMITQLATMMSNISKMYSDIAMNSVRNMK